MQEHCCQEPQIGKIKLFLKALDRTRLQAFAKR